MHTGYIRTPDRSVLLIYVPLDLVSPFVTIQAY